VQYFYAIIAAKLYKMRKIIPVLLLTLLGAASCKKLTSAVDKASSHGSLSATVGSKSYTAGSVVVTATSTAFMVKGATSSSDEKLDIFIDNYSKSKTKYTIGYVLHTANYYDNKSHHAVYGEVEVISTGDKSAKGTFSFTTEDSLKVTNGNFDVKWD
jgi:hypothetical protein